MQPKVAAEARAHAFFKRQLTPKRRGELLIHEVSYLVAPDNQDDPVWGRRMARYWMLQGLTYGLRLTDFANVVDYTKGTVRSYCMVHGDLPGERVDRESWELDGHAKRAREQVEALLP